MAADPGDALTVLKTGCAGDTLTSQLIFGCPVKAVSKGGGIALLLFRPGQVFGFEVRRDGRSDSDSQRAFLVRSGQPGDVIARLPAVRPGAHILVSATGKVQTNHVTAMLSTLAGLRDPRLVPVERWRVLGSRLVSGVPVSPEEFLR